MLPTEDLFVYVYVLIGDAIAAGTVAIPARPGPAPGCSDAELPAIALVRHLLGRRSEAGFFAEVARDWAHLFPVLPRQSEAVAVAAAETGGPVTCAMAAQRVGIDLSGRQSENVRARLKRLEDRGWLRRNAVGKFTIAP